VVALPESTVVVTLAEMRLARRRSLQQPPRQLTMVRNSAVWWSCVAPWSVVCRDGWHL